MTFEIIILLCVVGIFIILARRLPSVIKRKKNDELANIPFDQEEKSAFSSAMPMSLIDQADQFFNKNDYEQAEKVYIKLATQDPDNPKIYTRLGIIYLEQKNFRDAKDAFGEALRLDDKKASRYVNYGLACLNLKNFNEAIKSLESAIKLDPKNKKYQALLIEAKSKKKLVEKK